jgi:hypothetical protein
VFQQGGRPAGHEEPAVLRNGEQADAADRRAPGPTQVVFDRAAPHGETCLGVIESLHVETRRGRQDQISVLW